MIIQSDNPQTINVPKTYLANAQNSGVGTVYIKNPNGFQASWGVQLGALGEAESEIVVSGTAIPSGTSLVLTGTTKYAHAADTPVYAVQYDQMVFLKSASGTAGTAIPLSGGTVNLTPNFTYTQFDDTNALTTDAYQTYFLNSVSLSQSDNSDWVLPAGYSFYSLAKLTQRVRDKLWSSGYLKDDSVIQDWINEWRDELANSVVNINESYAVGSVLMTFGTNGLGTVTDPAFTNPLRLWISYDGGNTQVQSIKTQINEIFPGQALISANPRHAWIGNNVFQVFPGQAGGQASLLYYTFGTTMVNPTDELPQPMRSFTKSFIDYALAQAYIKDDKSIGRISQYDRAMNQATAAKLDFVNKITNRDETGENYIRLRDVLDGNDGYWRY